MIFSYAAIAIRVGILLLSAVAAAVAALCLPIVIILSFNKSRLIGIFSPILLCSRLSKYSTVNLIIYAIAS